MFRYQYPNLKKQTPHAIIRSAITRMNGFITVLSEDGASETYSHSALSAGQNFETGNTKRIRANNTRIAVPTIDKEAPDFIK
ncbi:MAG TPA: hypothetical protein VH415_05740 [Nitrososphaeraceae archaeon]